VRAVSAGRRADEAEAECGEGGVSPVDGEESPESDVCAAGAGWC